MIRKIRVLLLTLVVHLAPTCSWAQADSSKTSSPSTELSAFIDAFYVYDFNQPKTNYRQTFLYNHNRHNEFNINLAFVKISTQHKRYRANFALQAGTYSNDNYASETGTFRNIFEANAGFSLNKKGNLWLDAGIFASHIGFESAVSLENWTLTRSLLAENSPYYLAGAKLTYTPNPKMEIAFLVCNGWQRIRRVSGNSLPSMGSQLRFQLSKKSSLNWSTFVGTDDPDVSRRMRYFNNFYWQFPLTKRISLISGFDIGAQQNKKYSSRYNVWFSPVLIGQLEISKSWHTSLRAEYYQDEAGVIISTGTPHGFKTSGISLNFDYSPAQNVICRIEGRWLTSFDEVFALSNAESSRNNFILGASISMKLGK